MTYSDLKSVINDAYAAFGYNYVVRELLGADAEYSERQVCFVKAIYKTLMNQVGDESLDSITKADIQNCIRLMNKHANVSITTIYE